MTQVSPVQANEQDSLYRKNTAYQGSIPFEYYLNSAQGQGDSRPIEVTLNPQLHREIIEEIANAIPFAFGNFNINLFGLDQAFVSRLDLSSLIDEIIEQVKLVKEHGKTELIVGLKPENLGEILLSVTSRNGIVAIQITASENTKKILDNHLLELEMALKKARINLSELKVEAAYGLPAYSAG